MNILTLCDQFCEYSTHIRGMTKQTVRRYRFIIHSLCSILGSSDAKHLTEEAICQAFYIGRNSRNWSLRTLLTYHNSLSPFFKWCITRGYIQSNPLEKIERPKVESSLPRGIKQEDAMHILDVVLNYPYASRFQRHRNHAIMSMLIFSGLRKMELLNLRLVDVNIDNLSIFVRKGKGAKDRIIPRTPGNEIILQCPYAATYVCHPYARRRLRYLQSV